MRTFRFFGVMALLASLLPAGAQAQDFEALVEDALGREAPGEPAPPSAVPPRLGIDPDATAPPVEPDLNAPASPEPRFAEPEIQAPGLSPSLTAPRPYTPPRPAGAAEPAAAPDAIGETTTVPAAPAATADPDTAPDASMRALRVEEVNNAVFSPGADTRKGASPLILKAQILLDRAGASPGVIDGVAGGNVAKAIAAVETVLGLPIDGRLDADVWAALGGDAAPPVLIVYTITAEDVSYPFLSSVPPEYLDQAKLPGLNYTSPEEMFGERFHMDVKLLQALNPGVDMRVAGEPIIVADVVGQPVTGKIARIEADKRARQVRAYDAQDRLVVAYPATIGSAATPSPSGIHQVNTIAPNPVYYYNPDNFTTKKADRKLELPPGPNNPVGTMWIDLSQDGYGIHGTPEPSRIDKTASSGCIRLTNWDAEELATLVESGITVAFVE